MRREDLDHILIPQKDRMVFVPIRDVLYIESAGHYSKIVTPEKSYLSSYKISDFESRLMERSFIRAHRSYMVNINFIEAIETNGTHRITLTNGHKLPLSRRRIGDLIQRYGIY